jgi:hypothetical protein
MIDTIRRVYELYGFVPFNTPAIEFLDVLSGMCDSLEALDVGRHLVRFSSQAMLNLLSSTPASRRSRASTSSASSTSSTKSGPTKCAAS